MPPHAAPPVRQLPLGPGYEDEDEEGGGEGEEYEDEEEREEEGQGGGGYSSGGSGGYRITAMPEMTHKVLI